MRYLILTLLLFPSLIFSQEVVYGPAVAYKDKPGLAFDIVGVDDHIQFALYIKAMFSGNNPSGIKLLTDG